LIGYRWEADDPDHNRADDTALDALLARAKQRGVIVDFDTGRGAGVWFDAPAGKLARALRDEVESMLPKGWIRGK
jgi:hypothetical protein